MRLIDADGIKNSLLTELLMGVDGGTDDSYLKTYEVIDRIEKIVNEWVDNQPTVEAVPIEWIEKNYAIYGFIKELIEKWREENENN